MTSVGTPQEPKPRVLGSLRVSTREQAENGYGLVAQRQAVEDFCRAEGLDLVAVYEDGGVDGDLPFGERPGMQALMDDVRGRSGDTCPIVGVVVARFDRLGRDTLESLLGERELKLIGARVLSTQGFNDDDAITQYFRTNMMAMAQLDKAMLKARMASGKRAKASRGGYTGGRPYLGVRAEGKALVRDDIGAQVVRRIFEKVARHRYAVARLADEMNKHNVLGRRWSKNGLLMVLHREAYKLGEDPIVDPRVWNRAQRVLSERNTNAKAA
jgi:site-specific DNA recombinase